MKVKFASPLIFGLIFFLIFSSCKKNTNSDICYQYTGNEFGFETFEMMLDSIMQIDTTYAESNLLFKANDNYTNVRWKIGEDPREFTTLNVNLRFLDPEVLAISIKALSFNKYCNTEEKSYSNSLVLLPNDSLHKSPLTGIYKGCNTDNPTDIFSVSIKFWFGERYNWWPRTGAYSVENLPKGYSDSTKEINGHPRPEIRGIIARTTYKNIAIDETGNIPTLGIKGFGSLRRGVHDTLIFTYSIIDTAVLNKTGEYVLLHKKFIGVKN